MRPHVPAPTQEEGSGLEKAFQAANAEDKPTPLLTADLINFALRRVAFM